jgi:hypothetical protein
MATHYKGQRIVELLADIKTYEAKLSSMGDCPDDLAEDMVRAWTVLALTKAKLTSLQGNDNDKESI